MSDLHKELLAQLNELPKNPDYSDKDKYADFRKLFMGSAQGKRVYGELLAWGGMFNFKIPANPDYYKIGVNDGHRNYAIKLIAAVNLEPKEKATKAVNKRPLKI